MSDIIGSIRRLDFPESTQAAVDHLAASFSSGDAAIPGLGGADEEVAEDIATEFIFRETMSKHGHQKVF